MDDRIKEIVTVEGDRPAAPEQQQQAASDTPVPFRTPHSRDYPVLGYE